MNFRFRRTHTESAHLPTATTGHRMTSQFVPDICRFTLTCTCGEVFDTPYIDEALEIRELHETLAPLADQMTP